MRQPCPPADYIFGLGGNDVLDRKVEAAADDVRVRWAEGELTLVRRYAETRYGAASWKRERRVAARIEASSNGLDIRYVVTNIRRGSAEWLYDTLYCERGQAENLSEGEHALALHLIAESRDGEQIGSKRPLVPSEQSARGDREVTAARLAAPRGQPADRRHG